MKYSTRAWIVYLILTITIQASYAQPFAVGKRTIAYTDPARGNRSISTELYYPADVAGNNVPIASGSQQFPVIVFGHGFVIPVSSYNWLAERFVTAGYVLAMPSTESGLSPSHEQFGRDLAFLSSKIKSEGTDPLSFLFGRIWPKVAVGGHSMGGGCSFLATQYSTDINALFNFAAAETNPSATTAALSSNMPALIFSGSNDCIVPPATQFSMYANIPYACKSYINITSALHCQFANNNGTCAFGQLTSGCNSSSINASTVFDKVESTLLPFLDYFIKDVCTRGNEYLASLSNITGATTQTGCTSFPGCGVVAVKILDLKASRTNGSTNLQWKAAEESGLIEYIIERKTGQQNFREINRVIARGNSQPVNDYSFTDHTPLNGTFYYRLNMTYRDGYTEYSNWVRVTDKNENIDLISMYPNPGNHMPHVRLYSPVATSVDLTLVDPLGRIITKNSLPLQQGIHNYDLQNLAFISPGVYHIVIMDEYGRQLTSVKWVKK